MPPLPVLLLAVKACKLLQPPVVAPMRSALPNWRRAIRCALLLLLRRRTLPMRLLFSPLLLLLWLLGLSKQPLSASASPAELQLLLLGPKQPLMLRR
jgi:hypothetical protein